MSSALVPHVQLQAITKRFGATVALDGVDLSVRRGTVHALVGENGAGKSTVGKLVAGVHGPDSGRLYVGGEPVRFRTPRQALEHGCTIVAQELSLVPARTVIENVFLGFEEHSGPVVRKRKLERRFDELVSRSGIEVAGNITVRDLTVADQQKTEILRALARQAELVVMDEPTARLTAGESEVLRQVIRRLAEAGTTILFVSHFLDEVLEVADAITIMRDGRVVRNCAPAEETRSSLVESMIGRELDATFPAKRVPDRSARPVLMVRGLSRKGAFDHVDFEVGPGEIVVMAGLVGAGRSEVARAIYGADRPDAGTVELDGKPLAARNPTEAISSGLAMIPESRKAQGLQLLQSVGHNITLPHLAGLSRAGVVRTRLEQARAAELVDRVGIKAQSLGSAVTTLSGGNQQKVLFARSLFRTPRLLIADEPTRGVDVGAKRAIYDLIVDLAGAGTAVLVISSELEEVVGLAHRVLVMRRGQIAEELSGDSITDANVMRGAFGVLPPALLSKTQEVSG